MVAHICWSCGVDAEMVFLEVVTTLRSSREFEKYAAPFICNHCKEVNIAHVDISGFDEYRVKPYIAEGSGVFTWYPKRLEAPDLSVLPDHIREAAEEAHEARSVDLYRSSILMARAVIEAICKEQGIEVKDLHKKIDALAKAGKIMTKTRDLAHEVRLLGNKVAHGDKFEAAFVSTSDASGDGEAAEEIEELEQGDFATAEITADDADDVLDVLDSIIHQVYETDALDNRLKERRARRAR